MERGSGITTDQWVGALVAIAAALLIVWILRRAFARLDARSSHTAGTETRIRLAGRLLYALVLALGIALALSRFDAMRTLGTMLLTSSAILAATLGFAARQALANVVAGMMIAVTQPLRIGDHVEIVDRHGVVEDVTLSYTVLRTAPGSRVVVPNDTVVSSVLRNDSLAGEQLSVVAELWLAPDADIDAAARAVPGQLAVIAATPDGIHVEIGDGTATAGERDERAADLLRRSLQALSQAGLLPPRPVGVGRGGANTDL